MSGKHTAIVGGLAVGAAIALIYVIDKNRANLGKAIDSFANVSLDDIFTPAVVDGVVSEGAADDFVVVGTFGDETAAQHKRSKPKQV